MANQAVRREPSAGRIDTADPLADVLDAPLRRTSPDIDPYAPLGIRAGSFILYPSVETTVGYTTNGPATAGGSDSAFVSLTPEMRAVSDWSRHEASFAMRGTYEAFAADSVDDRPSASIEARGRLDHAAEWTTDLFAAYRYQEQALSDPDFPAGVDEPPGVHRLEASVETRGRFGMSVVEAGIHLDRTIYEDGESGGVEVDQGDRTNTEIGGRLRYGLAVTPLTTPFVEGHLSRRIHDRTVDNNGKERSAWTYGLRGGIAYRSDPVLSGEVALGYARSELDEGGMSAVEALTFDGSIVWSPTRLTTVTFAAATEFAPATDPLVSGSVIYDGAVDLAYRWRENVTLNGLAGVRHERFEGSGLEETTYRLGLGATWRLNRSLALSGGYLHEWLDSSDPSRDYESDSVRLTLRVER